MWILYDLLSFCILWMSEWTHDILCLFISVHVDSLKERAKLIDIAGMRELFKLSVSLGDVALFGIEETPEGRIIVALYF